MKPLSKQQIFNRAAKHLLTQRRSSLAVDNECRYRGPQGLMCAVGPFIKDEAYSEELEGSKVSSTDVMQALEDSGVSPDHFDLLSELQEVHDGQKPKWWKEKLSEVAFKFGLSDKVLKKFRAIRSEGK